MGLSIFKHSAIQVTGNLKNALRISAVLWGASTIPILLLSSGMPTEFSSTSTDTPESFGLGFPLAILLLLVVFALFSIVALPWIAVAWHRYVLKNELALSALLIPKTPVDAVAGYFWKGIILSFVLLLVLIPMVILAGVLGIGFLSSGSDIGAVVLISLVGAIGTYFMLRYALILPARAVNSPITVRDSWQYTSKVGTALWLTAFLLVLVNTGLSVLSEILVPGDMAMGGIPLILTIIINWITMMIGVSILTTLYGYCVENRELI